MKEKELHIEKADAYLEEYEYQEAILEYKRAAELTDNDRELAELYVKIGDCYCEFCTPAETDLDHFGVYFKLAYEKDPENEDAIRAVGEKYLYWKDEAACTYYEKLISLGKADDYDKGQLFLCYNRLGRCKDADKILENITKFSWWWGKSYMDARRYKEALELFKTALERMSAAGEWIPYDPYVLMGNCYEHLKEWDKAKESYQYGLQNYKTEYEQEQFYCALFLFYLRRCDFKNIRVCFKKIKTGWIISDIIEYEIDYLEALHNKRKPDTKKAAGIVKKTKYLYEQDNHRMYPYTLLAAGDFCRFYADDFEQARQFYRMAVGCMEQYSLSVCEEDLLIRIYLGYMEMAHQEKNPAEVNQYASLFMEQVGRVLHTKGESLEYFAQDGRNRDILYRYYCCLGEKEKAERYYDSLWDTPFVVSKYFIRSR